MDDDRQTQLLQSGPKKGAWIALPFLIATRACLSLALGWTSNLIVFLIDEFNIENINAAQIFNFVNGCITLFPILAAIIADSFLGCFAVIWISSIISLLGMVLLTLTATISSLRPTTTCDQFGSSSSCETTPSALQYTNLFLAIALSAIGCASTCFSLGTMGADQLDNPLHQESFFNWFLFVWNAASIISVTVIVYVQDNVSWGWGYGICAAANMLGLLSFVMGKRFYRHVQPQGSPFKDIARVFFAAIHKRQLPLSGRREDYYSELQNDNVYEQHDGAKEWAAAPSEETFKFLNRAALITTADVQSDGSIKQSCKLCTVEQVEDLKILMRIAPIWGTGIFLTTPMTMLYTLTLLQALTMDNRIFANFKFPVGSVGLFALLSGAISLTIVDRLLFPLWQKLFGKCPTPLQRLGTGHVINVLSIVIAALVESKRLQIAQSNILQGSTSSSSMVPMSVFWLVPQLALMGMGEAFHFPGQATFYYQEFPASLKSTSTAMVAVIIAIGYYTSMGLTDLVRRVTNWLPEDLNHGSLNNLYCVLFAIGSLNFGLYLMCAKAYKYREDSSNQSDKKLFY